MLSMTSWASELRRIRVLAPVTSLTRLVVTDIAVTDKMVVSRKVIISSTRVIPRSSPALAFTFALANRTRRFTITSRSGAAGRRRFPAAAPACRSRSSYGRYR